MYRWPFILLNVFIFGVRKFMTVVVFLLIPFFQPLLPRRCHSPFTIHISFQYICYIVFTLSLRTKRRPFRPIIAPYIKHLSMDGTECKWVRDAYLIVTIDLHPSLCEDFVHLCIILKSLSNKRHFCAEKRPIQLEFNRCRSLLSLFQNKWPNFF